MTPKKPVQPHVASQTPVAPTINEDQSIAITPDVTPVTPTPVAAQPKKVKPALPAHYLLTVKGVASIAGNGQSSVVSYQETIRCPELGEGKVDAHYLTHVLRDDGSDSLLIKAIRKTHGNCEAIRTHEVVSRIFVDANGNKKSAKNVQKVGGQEVITVASMRHAELEEYVKERQYAIDLELYTESDSLREAVASYEKNKEEFLIAQEKRREDVRIKNEMDALAEADAADANAAPLNI